VTDPRVWRVVGGPLVAGAPAGPLAGLTVAVKDVIAVAGHRLGAGVPSLLAAGRPQPWHAPALARLLAAGASVRGIARTDQLAYSLAGVNEHYPPPPNAAVPGAVPGGSSSGSASAVALREADIGLGTDTAGSIRVPASYQGLWGLRTTYGAVERTGVLPLATDFDTVGLLTRDAATLRAAASVLLNERAGREGAAAAFAVARQLLRGLDQPVITAFEAMLGRVRLLRNVREVTLPDPRELAEAFRVHQAWQAWKVHGAWVSAHPDALLGDVRERFEVASRVTRTEDAEARAELIGARPMIEAALGGRTLLLPSAAGPAPPLEAEAEAREQTRAATLRLTCIAGITGRPAVSVPVLEVEGAPVGLGLVGPRGSDLSLIALAAGTLLHPEVP
jgi:amidase